MGRDDDQPGLLPFTPPPNEYSDEPATDDQSRDANATDPTPSATDPKEMAARRNQRKFRGQRIEAFWRAALADQWARAALWELLDGATHIRETRFACGPNGFPQTEATWFELGQQSVGKWLWEKLQRTDFALFHEMLKENHPDFMPPQAQKKTRRDNE